MKQALKRGLSWVLEWVWWRPTLLVKPHEITFAVNWHHLDKMIGFDSTCQFVVEKRIRSTCCLKRRIEIKWNDDRKKVQTGAWHRDKSLHNLIRKITLMQYWLWFLGVEQKWIRGGVLDCALKGKRYSYAQNMTVLLEFVPTSQDTVPQCNRSPLWASAREPNAGLHAGDSFSTWGI